MFYIINFIVFRKTCCNSIDAGILEAKGDTTDPIEPGMVVRGWRWR